MEKCELFSFMMKILLLRHKVDLYLHGHIYIYIHVVCDLVYCPLRAHADYMCHRTEAGERRYTVI